MPDDRYVVRSNRVRYQHTASWIVVFGLAVVMLTQTATYPFPFIVFGALAIVSILLALRAFSIVVVLTPTQLTVKNLYRTYNVPTRSIRSVSPFGTASILPRLPGLAIIPPLRINCSAGVIDLHATAWLDENEHDEILERLEAIVAVNTST